MSPTPSTALVIGGGIAGTATALALHKAGIRPNIYEAHPSSATHLGAFLTVMPNGWNALAALDATQPVESASIPSHSTTMHDLTTGDIREFPSGRGHGLRTLTRSALNQALQNTAASRGVPINHGAQVDTVAATADGVQATFTDGATAEADLLVGADGIHSTIRPLIDRQAPEPSRAGLLVIYGSAHHAPHTEPERWRFIRGNDYVFGCTTDPRTEVTWWFLRAARTSISTVPQDSGKWRALAKRLTEQDTTPAPDIIGATDQVLGIDIHHLPHVPTWQRGRIVLVGDALHAVSPASAQGASMCAEDAAVLGKCLRDLPTVPAAFERYEHLRRQRVEAIVAMGAGHPGHELDPYDHSIDWDAPIST